MSNYSGVTFKKKIIFQNVFLQLPTHNIRDSM